MDYFNSLLTSRKPYNFEENNNRKWNIAYQRVEYFIKKYQTLPTNHNGEDLYNWLSHQRKKYHVGKLSEDKIKLLEALPFFKWGMAKKETHALQWMAQYEELKQIIETHYNGVLPEKITTLRKDGYVKAYRWLSAQVVRRNKLSPAQAALLKQLTTNLTT